MYSAPPTLAFAVIGQARSDGRMSPEQESTILGKLLTHWALSSTLDVSAACSMQLKQQVSRPAISEYARVV
jgi:hypothetical protein